ncbi:MAG: polysaccharide biosynthesis protein, partial [Alphaproteobacteria bacterium]|nr:polysaccharide biosynthesis protein [Alphaproteobacteria bacterium]
ACQPRKILLFEQGEPALYCIDQELRALVGDSQVEIVPVLGSVCDRALSLQVLARHKVDIILHAAAHKHVPLVEMNEVEGLRNNILGTRILAEAAQAQNVAHFVLISSDKAVRPTNVMGASKRLAELVIQDFASRSKFTRFSMVRFGNVLGSSGSVVPLFQEQIARGGPVTLTDRQVTRYFMTLIEAAQLVLLAGSFARGGDVFVLDMGKPVVIRDLARQMIHHAGYSVRDVKHPDGDIEIAITGLRPGEKLFEELLIGADMQTTPHPKILRAQEEQLSEIEVATMLKDLRVIVDNVDANAARALVRKWVKGYRISGDQEVG